MTVAREQWVIVGVTRTVTVVMVGSGGVEFRMLEEVDSEVGSAEGGRVDVRDMSGRLTTEREPRVRGCSGSWMDAMRSVSVERVSL